MRLTLNQLVVGSNPTSPVMNLTYKQFFNSVIAQDDDCDYDESGYVICVFPDNKAAIFSYSHGSYYGTWEALGGLDGDGYDRPDLEREINSVWNGTVDQLIHMAENNLDFSIEGRPIDPSDYDADHLLACYKQVREWKEKMTQEQKSEKYSNFRLSNSEICIISEALNKLGNSANDQPRSVSESVRKQNMKYEALRDRFEKAASTISSNNS